MKIELSEQYLKAQGLLKEDKIDEAKIILDKLCAQDDSNPFADMNYASIFAREGDFITAAKYYLRSRSVMQKSNEESFKNDIEFINVQLCSLSDDLVKKGANHLGCGDFDQAEKYFLVTKEIGSVAAFYNLAQVYIKKQSFAQAREHLKESLDISLKMLTSTDVATKNLASQLIADTHNLLGVLDIQGQGCPNQKPNPLRALQNFKSALSFIPEHTSAKANKAQLKSIMSPESVRFFKQAAQAIKLTNGRVSFVSFILKYANNPNIESYIKENPNLNPGSALDDLLSHYLAGTAKKISFSEENTEQSDSKMQI
ncbi:MAG: hypothetical protein WC627_09845 [Legionella sp.]|jgi:tetratricopeptide (TPR) repeat protein